MTPPRRLVVVGASLAGVRAVQAAREAGFTGHVVLVGAEEHLPYDRPPLSKSFLEATAEPAAPAFRSGGFLRHQLGVDLRLGAPATGLDTVARTVTVAGVPLGYDRLVIATGAQARRLPGAGRLAGVHTLRTLDDARAVRRALHAGARTVVVGAGFIGSEVASSARKRGLPVTVVEAAPTPLARAIGEVTGTALAALHAANGTVLRCGVTVTGLEGDGRVERVLLSDGTVLPADLVVVGVGAVPVTGWLAGSGLVVRDGVVCDRTLATSAAGVYAAGDVARWWNPLFGRYLRLEHWTSAAEQGVVAARNAVSEKDAEPYETVPYFWSDWYGTRIQFVGVPEGDHVESFGGDDRFVALYRDGDRLAGALAVNRPSLTMKYRALIRRRAGWAEALELAARGRAAAR
ncbi:NAD(P)/FAD-dependent oxidoreductase [Amycolatopsis australiensis]|uniref:Reductase C-terminal n=1 Tax=Amycolatopsis australiensis TaxID=546364 RepID=A0A1K1S2B6_9PSEU|nr:FAD-dependent oxidoreductase [Amycolatopsis australiensis]SFW78454.1 Reductase C-terminal [Amycolatopsis australiensis]